MGHASVVAPALEPITMVEVQEVMRTMIDWENRGNEMAYDSE